VILFEINESQEAAGLLYYSPNQQPNQ